MSRVSLQQLLLSGAHFGHLTRRWHPKMKPYILMKKNGIHLIDLRKTQECLDTACAALMEIASKGEQILLVGTKSQARDIMAAEATRAGIPYVTERWLGGMLTNFQTIRQGIKTLASLEKKMTDGTYEKITKKERLTLDRRRAKLLESIGGIRELRRAPGAVFIVDVRREKIAVAEARRLGITIVAITDTNVDPDLVNYAIPANDDAFKSIGLITRAVTDAIIEGMNAYRANPLMHEAAAETAAREVEHHEARDRGRKQEDTRPRRVRKPPEDRGRSPQHTGEEKPPSLDKPAPIEPTIDKPAADTGAVTE